MLISTDDVDFVDAYLEAGTTHVTVMTGSLFDLAPIERLIARRDL